VASAGVAPTARAKAEQVKSLAAENIKKRHIALQLGSVSAACSESSALRIEARCAGAPRRQGVAQGWFRREPDPGAADVVITAPRNDLAFDLEDLGADRLEAVEASPDRSQQSAAQPFAQQARCSRVPAKCSGLDLTSAENLS
jgi:hypothetical protein